MQLFSSIYYAVEKSTQQELQKSVSRSMEYETYLYGLFITLFVASFCIFCYLIASKKYFPLLLWLKIVVCNLMDLGL